MELFDRGLDRGLIGRQGQGGQVAGFRIDRKPGLGDQLFEQSEQLFGVGQSNAVDLQHRLARRGGAGQEFFDCQLQPGLVGRCGPGQQLLGLRIDREFGVGCHRLERFNHADGSGVARRQIELATGYVANEPGGRRAGFQVVEPCKRVDLEYQFLGRVAAGFDQINGRTYRGVIARGGHHHQAFAGGVDRHLGFRHQVLQYGKQTLRRLFVQGVHLEHGSVFGNLFRLELIQRDLDRCLILGSGNDDQFGRLGVDSQFGLGHERLQCVQQLGAGLLLGRIDPVAVTVLGRHHTGRTRGIEKSVDRVDLHDRCARRGAGGCYLIESRLNPGVVLRLGHHHQPLAGRVDRHLGFRHQVSQYGKQAVGRLFVKGVHLKRLRVFGNLGRLELIECGLDRGLVLGACQGDQPGRTGVENQSGLGHHRLERRYQLRAGNLFGGVDPVAVLVLCRHHAWPRGGGQNLLDRVDLQNRHGRHRRHGRRRNQLVDNRLDLLMLGGGGQHDQLLGRGVERELRSGSDRLEGLDDRRARRRTCGGKNLVSGFVALQSQFGPNRHIGRQTRHRVDLQVAIFLGRTCHLDLLQGRLDRRMLGRQRPDQQPPGLVVGHDLGLGKEIAKHLDRALGVDPLERVGDQLIPLALGHLTIEFLEDLGDQLVLHRLGPYRKLTRLGVDDHLHAAKLTGERLEHRLEPLSLCRVHGIHSQLGPAFKERGLLNLVDGRLDPRVFRGRCHHHQPHTAGLHREGGPRRTLFEHLRQAGWHGKRQLVEPQLGQVIGRRVGLQAFERFADHFLIGRHGQGDQAPGLRVDRQLGFRQDGSQQRDRRGRIDFGQAVDLQLPALRRGRLGGKFLDRCCEQYVFGRCGPGYQLSGLDVYDQLRPGHDFLKSCHEW